MELSIILDNLHFKARQNKWLGYFTVFCRIALAAGFLPSGMQKVLGERFTALAVNHPMGNFLEAFYHTGYFYTFVGTMQVLAAILLLIPRTALLGALIYFPIILNICILSLAVRFDGSQVTSPLMVCAVLYILCWDYHKLKNIFPFNDVNSKPALPQKHEMSNKLPIKFFASTFAIVVIVVVHARLFYDIMPRNTISDCKIQCIDENDVSCIEFCECIHTQGLSLDKCLKEYNSTTQGK